MSRNDVELVDTSDVPVNLLETLVSKNPIEVENLKVWMPKLRSDDRPVNLSNVKWAEYKAVGLFAHPAELLKVKMSWMTLK